MIDRTRQFANGFSSNMLRQAGAKPRRVDEKTVSFSYAPSVLTDTFDNTVGAQTFIQYKISPWLPCRDINNVGVWNASTTDHLGIAWVVENLGTPLVYTIERVIELEFKKPVTVTTQGVTPPVNVDELVIVDTPIP